MADFVEICNVCARKVTIEAAKRIINSDKVCHSYSDLNFGVTFLEHSVYTSKLSKVIVAYYRHINRQTYIQMQPKTLPRRFAGGKCALVVTVSAC